MELSVRYNPYLGWTILFDINTFNKKSASDIQSTEAIKWKDKYWRFMADITVESQSDWSCVCSEMCQQNIMEGLTLNDTSYVYRTMILVQLTAENSK